jgi:hypothetical protein
MTTKLTLRLEDSLIAQAKEFAQAEEKSISQIVADYFKTIQRHSGVKKQQIGPLTSRLAGCLKYTGIVTRNVGASPVESARANRRSRRYRESFRYAQPMFNVLHR